MQSFDFHYLQQSFLRILLNYFVSPLKIFNLFSELFIFQLDPKFACCFNFNGILLSNCQHMKLTIETYLVPKSRVAILRLNVRKVKA